MEFYSHPGVHLSDHLKIVANEAYRLLDHPALKDREYMRELAFIAGVSHDFGKFTSFFQQHLNGEKVKENLFYHSLISALFAAYITGKKFPEDPLASLIVYLAVHRHHGSLYMPQRTWPDEDDIIRLKKQWQDLVLHKEAIRGSLKQVWQLGDGGFLDQPFEKIINELVKKLKITYRKIRRNVPDCEESPEELKTEHAKTALKVQLVYSSLISADKFAAANLTRPTRRTISHQIVDEFVKGLNNRDNSPIITLRKQLQQEVYKKIEMASAPGIFTLTAPTGSGKTLTVLKSALKIRMNLENHWKIPPRIIYALPFVNLIEQVEDVLRKVLAKVPEYQAAPEQFLVSHHHMAEIKYRDDGEEHPVQESLLLIEDWESEIIVTTFVQIFHTLFGYTNRHMKKLHNLIGSILILDEPQQFPSEYWKTIGWMIELLNEEMGITTILMTATQPKILQGIPYKKLVSKDIKNEFYKHLNRYTVEDLQEEETFFNTLQRELGKKKSILIVVNTIRTSLKLWDYIKNETDWQGNSYYLSTNIIPLHRIDRIEQIRTKLNSGEPLIVVATQVIEAGVDLDFDVVFREISPLDSLIQAAGRCNREGKKGKGLVYRFKLTESLRSGSLVYGKTSLEVAREIWEGSTIDETMILSLIQEYFHRLLYRNSQMPSWCLWEHYARLLFSDPKGLFETLKDYPLISPKTEITVIVPTSKSHEDKLETLYQHLFLESDFLKRQETYLKNRRWLHERTLQILPVRAMNNPPPVWKDTSFRWIPFTQLKDFYDEHTGFKWREEDLKTEVWIL